MTEIKNLRLFFIINNSAGNNQTDWIQLITEYFKSSDYIIQIHVLNSDCSVLTLKEKIKVFMPQHVIAVGGDGTVRLVAECLLNQNIALGILPAGTSNGLAKELGISTDPLLALNVIAKGYSKKIHIIKINNQLCIHLSDIGINAFAMKNFKTMRNFGILGYLYASIRSMWHSKTMELELKTDHKTIKTHARMVVLANATTYGSGTIINPIGKLYDNCFEVIIVKKISVAELLKMTFSHKPFDQTKTELLQTTTLTIETKQEVDFQIDGEYLGKVRKIEAVLIPNAIMIIVPRW